MVGTTIYNHSTNIITTVGGTAVAPITFNDLWLADKAGTLENVHARAITGADANPVAVDHALRPTDLYVLGLADVFITVSNFTVNSTIRIVGTEQYGAAQTEDIPITANGTYNSTKYWRTIASTQVIVFGGNFTYVLTQGQWGVVWKQSSNQYLFDAKLIVGLSGTPTYFTDMGKQVTWSHGIVTGAGGYVLLTKTDAILTLGQLDDLTTKSTSKGCQISILEATYDGTRFPDGTGGTTYFYGCSFIGAGGKTLSIMRFTRAWNCLLDKAYLWGYASSDIYNPTIMGVQYALNRVSTVNADKITVLGATGAAVYNDTSGSAILYAKNFTAKYCAKIVLIYNDARTYSGYLINPDVDTWDLTFASSPNVTIYRHYTFDLKVTDKDNAPISGATVILKDKDGNVLFTVNTAGDGTIAQQTVSRGYYNQANGNTLQEYSPHTLTIAKAGFQTYTKVFTLSDKIIWQITLFKARPILSDGGKLVVSVSPTNPENMIVIGV